MPYHTVTDEMRRKTEEQLRVLEIPHLANRPMTEMSSGEVHREGIARALVHDPKALLLDEPSNSLDLRAQRDLRAIVRKLAQSGIGIILVTHHLDDIIPEVSRVILLHEGRVTADGRKADVLRADRLGELFGMPVELHTRDGYYHLL